MLIWPPRERKVHSRLSIVGLRLHRSRHGLASGSAWWLNCPVPEVRRRSFSSEVEIIRDTPRHLLSICGEFNAADKVWGCFEAEVGFQPKRFH